MAKPTLYHKRFQIQPYGPWLDFYAGPTHLAGPVLFNRYGIDLGGQDGMTGERGDPGTEGEFVVWVKDLDDLPTLAHEMLHVTVGVLRRAGLSLTPESEEAYTYLLDHLLTRVLG